MARLVRYLAVGACLALVMPAAALAKPGYRSFDRTYPYASRLCTAAQAGKLPRKLRGDGPQLVQACSALAAAFSQAQSSVRASEVQLATQLQADRLARRQACQQARQAHDPAACKAARATFAGQAQALRAQRRSAFEQYFAAVEGARKAFWATVRSLRGAASVKPDSPVKQ